MDASVSRVLVKTMVRKAIREIKETPERSTRNLVDLALNFSDGRFQRNFFQTAQKMLENNNSAYFSLIREVLSFVDEEKLLTFGMNLGFNGCTVGAEQIRSIEAKEGYNIPWSVSIKIRCPVNSARAEAYHSLISQGEELGIHSWLLLTEGDAETCLDLSKNHPESAFVMFCSGNVIDDVLLEHAASINNLAFVILFDSMAPAVCKKLREKGLIFGLYYTYSEPDLERIENGNLLRGMERFEGAFSVLLPEEGCPEKVQERVYKSVIQARMEQKYRTIVWEMCQDTLMVDKIISDDGCLLAFDEQGNLYPDHPAVTLNLFQDDLTTILRTAFPKERAVL